MDFLISRSIRGFGNTQGKGDVATKLTFILKEVRVIREQFPHDLIVGFLALGVPHLLIASHGEDADGLSHLPLSFPGLPPRQQRGPA